MTPQEIQAARGRHKRNRVGTCTVDHGEWPCSILQAADVIERLRSHGVKAQQALALLVGVDAVPGALMPGVVEVLIEPTAESPDGFVCRLCHAAVERGRPDLHDPICVLAVARPGHGLEAS